MEIAIIALLGLLVLCVLWLIFAMSSRGQGKEIQMLQGQYESLRAEVNSALSSNLKLVSDQMASVTMQLQASTGQINTRMDNTTRVVGEVRHHLGELSRATEQIFEVGRDISSLQEILRAPKLRGGLGELFLGDLLSQCLPSTHFDLQHTFKNGARVDAIVRFNGCLVPIDSKFPLENFKKGLDALTEEGRRAARRKFIGDCKKHIDAIASSYILPEEGTLNFALMYIPAENVYYETIIRDEEFGDEKLLGAYAFSKRVIPVSPNSFYAYLQTILLGLRGLEMNEKAKVMLSHIEGLKNDFDRFETDMDTLGKHINNTKAKFDEAQRKSERFKDRLLSLGDVEGADKDSLKE